MRRRTTCSASSFWYCHSTSPRSVTQPFDTVALTLSDGTPASHSNARTAARAMSASVRSDLDVVGYCLDAIHAVGCFLGTPFLQVGVHPAGQRDHTVFHGHANLVRLDLSIPLQLSQHISLHLFVSSG